MDSDCRKQPKCVAQPLLASGLWQEPRATLWDLSLDFKNATVVSNCVIKTTNKGWWTMKNDKQTNQQMGAFFSFVVLFALIDWGSSIGLLVSMSSSMKKFHELRIGSIFFSTVLGMWRSTCFPNKIVFNNYQSWKYCNNVSVAIQQVLKCNSIAMQSFFCIILS